VIRQGGVLQLQVDIWCIVICANVERWLEANRGNADVLNGLGEHARIWNIDQPRS
jgi:hypothetical protein